MAGGPVFQRARRVVRPQSLSERRTDYSTDGMGPDSPYGLDFRRFLDCAAAGFGGDFTRCWGGVLATTPAARSKRSQASGCNSSSFVCVDFGMTYRINPAFDRFPVEAKLVGLILSSFGELELTICQCAGDAIKMQNAVLKTLYLLRATSSRIDTADGLMRPLYEEHGLTSIYDDTMRMLRHCLTIRNQYAHCNWADSGQLGGGLFFADLRSSAKHKNFDHAYKHVDPTILNRQLDFFEITLEWLRFMDNEMAVKQERPPGLEWPKPPSSTPPPLHNPASQHIPPWLTAEQRAAHLKRALESEQHGQPQQRPPSVLKLTEEEWLAKYRKEGRSPDEGDG